MCSPKKGTRWTSLQGSSVEEEVWQGFEDVYKNSRVASVNRKGKNSRKLAGHTCKT